MRMASRLTVVGLVTAAAVAVGSVAFMAPASANDAMIPTAPSATTTAFQPIGSTALEPHTSGPQAGEPQTSEQSSAKWKGGAARDLDTGTWRATITRGDVTMLLGHYETEKEAKKAARKEARELNGVMDGPGCDPPFVLC